MPDASPTLREKLAALDELAADAEFRLTDAELALREVATARRGFAAKLYHDDARMARVQLAVLAEARAWLLAGQPQEIPAIGLEQGQEGQAGVDPASGTRPRSRARPGASSGLWASPWTGRGVDAPTLQDLRARGAASG